VRHAAEHDEVVAALRAIGNPRRGEAVRLDRGSQLEHLGIGFPALRARVKQGFSFSRRPFEDQLPIWHALWQQSAVGDVLFAALAFLEPAVRKQLPPTLWPLLVQWPARVDNWCHADMLANVNSFVLQAQPAEVLPQLLAWSQRPGAEWQRRIALASLIHYSGRNAVFLPPAQMLPVLAAAVGDARPSVQLALGWVLREIDRQHPAVVDAFLAEHAGRIGAAARRRALEKRAKP
jgi:3-methyladenine DNA glycosylase AlkD